MDGLLQSSQATKRNWFPIIAAFVLLAIVLVLLLLFSGSKAQLPIAPPAYAANIKLTNVHMITAENFVGSSVTYIEGTVTNAGSKTLTGTTVELVFKNSLHEIVQREDVPLLVLRSSNPYRDFSNLRDLPLQPDASRDFRLSLEHISADWNQQYPELKIVDVTTK
jgi:hypothetical protein